MTSHLPARIMSTEITPKSLEGKLHFVSFWGGEHRGSCLQMTSQHGLEYNCIQLTQREVFDLVDCLLRWSAEQQNRKLSGTHAGITTKGQQ